MVSSTPTTGSHESICREDGDSREVGLQFDGCKVVSSNYNARPESECMALPLAYGLPSSHQLSLPTQLRDCRGGATPCLGGPDPPENLESHV
ncbi:unnamed protein product [Linum trigynum]|uniref:Uncharacterized protein n=1 Tax=Linum trigynum TaxID=586398 RepID=A0AAV2C9T0_9ROSI